MKLLIRNKDLRWHILGLCLVILYEQGMLIAFDMFSNPTAVAAFYVVDISLFYTVICLSIPFLFQGSRKYLRIVFGITLTYTCYALLQFIAGALTSIYDDGIVSWAHNEKVIKKITFRFTYIYGIGLAYYLAQDGIQKAKYARNLEIKQLQTEKYRLELEAAYLQAQINPHLLFNTLNYLNHLVKPLSEKASTATLLLSDIMHYALRDVSAGQMVKLEEELEQVKNYLELIRFRNEEKLKLKFETFVSDEMMQIGIPPLVMITCLENMLKHGDLHDDKHPALLEIHGQKGKLLVTAINAKKQMPYSAGHGIGLQNMKKRLEMAFPGNYTLTINETSTTFELNLTILIIL